MVIEENFGLKNGDHTTHFADKEVILWNKEDVRDWLNSRGFVDWSQNIAMKHRVDGPTLLLLREEDLRLPPLAMNCLGDMKRLSADLSKLQAAHSRMKCELNNNSLSLYTSSLDVNSRSELLVDENQINGEVRTLFMSSDELIRRVESPDTIQRSLIKLALALLYCLFALLVTSFVMVLVHDRVPNMKTYPPLPDIVLDNIPLIPWAFECCEMIILIMSLLWMIILVFHKHRIVIVRRMFSLIGSIFLLRCITMLITSLSVPGIHLECRAYSYGNIRDKLKQAFHIWIHLGMSIQGVRTCGDYMFSGHTATITLLNHFITEYTPDGWRGLHTLTWVLNIFGVFFILAGHEHYSIDVFIAFYITSRMFLSYHANAHNYASLAGIDSRVRIWFPLGWFFESGVIGRVKNEFEIPHLFSTFKKISTEPSCTPNKPKSSEMLKSLMRTKTVETPSPANGVKRRKIKK